MHLELQEGEVGVEDHPLCLNLVGEEGAVEGAHPYQVEAGEEVVGVGLPFLVAGEVVEVELQMLVEVVVGAGEEVVEVHRSRLSLHSRVTVFADLHPPI